MIRYSFYILASMLGMLLFSCEHTNLSDIPVDDQASIPIQLYITRATDASMLAQYPGYTYWHINGEMFPDDGTPLRMALMIFNRDRNETVFSELVSFTSKGGNVYQTSVQLPMGESEFYVCYAPNQIGKDLPYYDPQGIYHTAIPWDFLTTGTTAIDRKDLTGAAFPAIIDKQNDDTYTLPATNPYDGVTPSPETEKIVRWQTTSDIVWSSSDTPGYANMLHMALASGKLVAEIGEDKPRTLTIPLFRDFARIRLFIGTRMPVEKGSYNIDKIAFLNFPIMMSPSFRENDTDASGLSAATPSSEKVRDYTGAHSYGYADKQSALAVYPVSYTAAGNVDYEVMSQDRDYEHLAWPQYLAPFIPATNTWQAGQLHPQIMLGVIYTSADQTQTARRFFRFDVGEQTAPGVFSGPIYPNREYRVYAVLPESIEQEIEYNVEDWTMKTVDIPPFK